MAYAADFEHEVLDVGALATAELNKIGDLLDALQLSRWTDTFNEESIDLPTLFFVQDEQLLALGLSVSERVKLLRCVQLLKDVPPPPASMSMKWKKEAPPRPTPRVRFEEKVEEVSAAALGAHDDETTHILEPEEDVGEVKEEEAEELQGNDAQEYEEEPLAENESSSEVPIALGAAAAAAAAVAAAGAIGVRSGSASDESYTPAHSRVYICCDKNDQAERICDALQAVFEDEVGLNQGEVKFLVPEEPAHITMGLESTLEESLPTDDLLWVILAFNGADDELVPGVSFSQLVESVERRYKGRRVIFVVDSCVVPHLAESDASLLNDKLEMALLYTVSPVAPNPCFLCLCLVDALKGNVFARPNERFTLKHFVDDALDSVRFVGRCMDRPETVSEYIATPGFVDEDLDMFPPRASVLTSANPACGLRGVYASERPVQVIEMNGRERAHVRFLDDLSDPEWVDLAEVVPFDDPAAAEAEQEESGRNVPLPLPPVVSESVETEEAFEEGESGRDMPLPVPPGDEQPSEVLEEVVEEEQPLAEDEVVLEEEVPAAAVSSEYEETMEIEPEAQIQEEAEVAVSDDLAPLEEAISEQEPVEEHVEEPTEALEEQVEEVLLEEEVPAPVDEAVLEEEPASEVPVLEEEEPTSEVPVLEEEEPATEVPVLEEEEPANEALVEEEQLQEGHEVALEEPSEEVTLDEEPLQEDTAMMEEAAMEEVIEEPVTTMETAPPPPAIRSDSILSEHSARELPVASVATMEELEELPIDDTPDMEGINDIEPDMDMLHEEIILDDDLLDVVEGEDEHDAVTKAS